MKKSRFIRVFAAILSVVMLLQLTLPVGAVDETFVRTGAESADMIAAARAQLGYTAPETGAKYNQWFEGKEGTYSYAWCQTFLSWCADQAGISTEIIAKESTVGGEYAFFVNQKRYRKSVAQGGTYTPRPGDIAFYSETSGENALTHVGLVTAVGETSFQTIEGNVSNQVMACERQLDSSVVIGYGCPLYADLPNLFVPELPEMTIEPGSTYVSTNFQWTESADAYNYRLVIWKRDTDQPVVDQEMQSLAFQKVLPAGDYTAQLSAQNGDNIVSTEKQDFTVEEHNNPYDFTISASSISDYRPITISWTNSLGALGYRIFIQNADTGETLAEKDLGNVHSYTLKLERGNYLARVTAYHDSYETTEELTWDVRCIHHNVPYLWVISAGDENTPTEIRWDSASCVIRYQLTIQRTKQSGVPSSDEDSIIVEKETGEELAWSGMLPEGYYKVTLRTYNLEGELSPSYASCGRVLRIGKRVPGDLNDDGEVNKTDVWQLNQYILGEAYKISDPATLSVADLNGDGVVNGFDLVLLRQMVK